MKIKSCVEEQLSAHHSGLLVPRGRTAEMGWRLSRVRKRVLSPHTLALKECIKVGRHCTQAGREMRQRETKREKDKRK